MSQNQPKQVMYNPPNWKMQKPNSKDHETVYRQSLENPEKYWADQAEELNWFKKWEKVLDDSNPPFYRWFVGGQLNIFYNAVERHLDTWRRNKLALIWEGEPGDLRTFSYHALNREVCRFMSVMKSMGVQKGDIVTIFMPQIPELVIAMLATAKLGAVHNVVLGGFSGEALAERISLAESRMLITADGGWWRGKIQEYKSIADEALRRSPTVEACITVKRTGQDVHMETDRDFWYHDVLALSVVGLKCETETMDAEDPLFLLFTSGTTGKPKGLIHTHGGYSVYTSSTLRQVFGLREEDRWWCAADIAWITGHSYIVYGPLINGATVMLYEGATNYPYPSRWWQMVEKYGINILYTFPTAIRRLMRYGDVWPKRHNIDSLRLLGTVGEPIGEQIWQWFYREIGRERCPIVDTWWQTETGGVMIAPPPGMPLKPGSVGKPLPGIDVAVVDDNGKEVKTGETGNLVIRKPWPGMARTIFKDPDRYEQTYWDKGKNHGNFQTGDTARQDEDGYFWVSPSEVIKVSGYRLGAGEIEDILTGHPKVAEAVVLGVPHKIKGNALHVTVVLRPGELESEELRQELIKLVVREIGRIAEPESIEFVDSMPRTRSGKIMRRVLYARALGTDEGDTTTLNYSSSRVEPYK
jgi:acetyl-CoA synthetase